MLSSPAFLTKVAVTIGLPISEAGNRKITLGYDTIENMTQSPAELYHGLCWNVIFERTVYDKVFATYLFNYNQNSTITF